MRKQQVFRKAKEDERLPEEN